MALVWLAVLILQILALMLAPLPRPVREKMSHKPPVSLMGRSIWAAGEIEEGIVSLFRHHSSLPSGMELPELWTIAGIRYDVGLDGNWLGRGPAHFSRIRQWFDIYTLDSLLAGQHTLAVLVQYVPNSRRSESSQPALQASLRAWDGDVGQTIGEIDTERPE